MPCRERTSIFDPTMKKHTLGKAERLKSRKQLDALFRSGKAFNLPPYRVLFSTAPLTDEKVPALQFGVGVSSRHFKRAVHRNLVKRRIREAYRQQRHALEALLREKGLAMQLFFICTARELPEWDLLNDNMGLALQKLEKDLAR